MRSDLQPETVKRLQLIVEKAKHVHEWRYMTFMRDEGIRTEVLADLSEEPPVVVVERYAPDQESLHALFAALRFFCLPNENIMLFRDGWLTRDGQRESTNASQDLTSHNHLPEQGDVPRRRRPIAANSDAEARECKQPKWFQEDAALSDHWKAWWLDIQGQLNKFLAREMGPIKFSHNGEVWTHGDIFEAFLFGEASHSTQQELLKKCERDEFIYTELRSTLDHILHLLYVGIFNIAEITKLELEGHPIPPPTGEPLSVAAPWTQP